MKIAVLSRGPKNYTTQRLIEAISKGGHEGVVINHAKCYMRIEENKPTVHYEGESLTDIDVIIPRVGQSITEYGAAVVRQFEMMKVYSSIPGIALVRSRDKLRSLQLLARAGVGIPKTVFARQDANTEELIEMAGGAPLVIKLTEGTHGVGVVLAETRKAAKSVIEAFYGLGASILIQEYIEEAHGSDVRMIVVGDKVVGSMMRQGTEEDFRSNLHRGGRAIPVEITSKERNMAIKAARTLGLSIAGVDIIRSSRGPLVLEVNSSPGLQGIESIVGKTVAEDIIDYVLVQAGGRRRRDKIGA